MIPLAAFPAIKTDDPDEVYASIKGRNPGMRAMLFGGRRDRAHLTANHVILGTTALVAGRSSPYRMELEPDDAIRVQIPSKGRMSIGFGSNEREAVAGRSSVLPPGPATVSVLTNFASTVVILSRPRIEELMRAIGSEAQAGDVLARHFGHPGMPGMNTVTSQVHLACRRLDEEPSRILALEPFRAALDDLIAISVADALAQAGGLGPESGTVQPVVLRRCLDYIHSHYAGTVSMTGLQQHAGVSLRTVQDLFRRHLDCSITSYLRRVRLDAARARLLLGHAEDTVTAVAYAAGFNHMGEFSTAYRRAFGERPSDTLRDARPW
jgi:AraC-like DNA-binding protein